MGKLRGLILVAPHGDLVASGEKTVIVKSRPFDMGDAPMLLLQGKQALGRVRLGEGTPIGVAEFRRRRPQHCISEQERLRWWGGHRVLWAYPVVELVPFRRRYEVEYPRGPQVFVRPENLRRR